MNLTDNIAQHIIDVHAGINWTDVNIKNTVQNITYSEASTHTDASANSIAALLHHITFYNEVVLKRINGNDPAINAANGFDVNLPANESEWQQLQKTNLDSAKELANAVKNFPEEKLFLPLLPGSSTAYKTYHGVVEHAHYHLGQIVILKNLIRNKKQNGS